MARIHGDKPLLPSLLDRLIDPESAGTAAKPGYTVEQMFLVVRRDLEDLLNTRQGHHDFPPEYKEVTTSVQAFGVPDLVSFNALTTGQRQEIGVVVEAMIARFEPRLRDVQVTLVEGRESGEYRLRFHVNAKLALDPAPEVAFDTILELSTGTGQYAVGGKG
jgi:type VI secretion system protein ImpF